MRQDPVAGHACVNNSTKMSAVQLRIVQTPFPCIRYSKNQGQAGDRRYVGSDQRGTAG